MAKKFPADLKRIIEEAKFDHSYSSESDRGKVILGAARLDDLLRLLISRAIIGGGDSQPDELFDNQNALLQSFGSKISIAYRFGLISEAEHYNLKTIKEIRNAFAHNLHDISFDHSWVKDACMRFRFPDNWFPTDTDTSIIRFQGILYQLDLELQRRIALTGRVPAVIDFTWEVSGGAATIRE